jgi:hypothetical protein
MAGRGAHPRARHPGSVRPVRAVHRHPGPGRLRHVKVHLKISGCFRSLIAIRAYCRIHPYLITIRLNAARPCRPSVTPSPDTPGHRYELSHRPDPVVGYMQSPCRSSSGAASGAGRLGDVPSAGATAAGQHGGDARDQSGTDDTPNRASIRIRSGSAGARCKDARIDRYDRISCSLTRQRYYRSYGWPTAEIRWRNRSAVRAAPPATARPIQAISNQTYTLRVRQIQVDWTLVAQCVRVIVFKLA